MERTKYINGDIVMYDNRIRVIKEPRDNNHYDLYEPKTKLTVAYTSVNDIKPVILTEAILVKNGWEHKDNVFFKYFPTVILTIVDSIISVVNEKCSIKLCSVGYVHELQHLLYSLYINSEMKV